MRTPAKRQRATATGRRTSRSAPEEKHGSSRVPVEGRVLLIREGGGVSQPAQMRDVSRGGAFLETEPVPVGEEIRVEVAGDYSVFSMDAIVIRNITKQFRKSTISREYTTLKSELVNLILGRRKKDRSHYIEVLKGIDFAIPKGKTVGIIGRNRPSEPYGLGRHCCASSSNQQPFQPSSAFAAAPEYVHKRTRS